MIKLIKRWLRRKVDAKDGNFTRVGFPVRVMTKTSNGWRFSAGQISRVQGTEVDLWVFPCTGEKPHIIKSPRFVEFKKKGFPWWDFPVKDFCYVENLSIVDY